MILSQEQKQDLDSSLEHLFNKILNEFHPNADYIESNLVGYFYTDSDIRSAKQIATEELQKNFDKLDYSYQLTNLDQNLNPSDFQQEVVEIKNYANTFFSKL
jgi:hypothetical protein